MDEMNPQLPSRDEVKKIWSAVEAGIDSRDRRPRHRSAPGLVAAIVLILGGGTFVSGFVGRRHEEPVKVSCQVDQIGTSVDLIDPTNPLAECMQRWDNRHAAGMESSKPASPNDLVLCRNPAGSEKVELQREDGSCRTFGWTPVPTP